MTGRSTPWLGSNRGVDRVPWNGFPLAFREISKLQGSDAGSMQSEHGTSLAREHPLHLVIAAFGQLDPRVPESQDLESCRQTRFCLALQHEGS